MFFMEKFVMEYISYVYFVLILAFKLASL